MNPEELIGLSQEQLEDRLHGVYDQLSELAGRQRELNQERDQIEGDRNILLVELGRLGVQGWDVA